MKQGQAHGSSAESVRSEIRVEQTLNPAPCWTGDLRMVIWEQKSENIDVFRASGSSRTNEADAHLCSGSCDARFEWRKWHERTSLEDFRLAHLLLLQPSAIPSESAERTSERIRGAVTRNRPENSRRRPRPPDISNVHSFFGFLVFALAAYATTPYNAHNIPSRNCPLRDLPWVCVSVHAAPAGHLPGALMGTFVVRGEIFVNEKDPPLPGRGQCQVQVDLNPRE